MTRQVMLSWQFLLLIAFINIFFNPPLCHCIYAKQNICLLLGVEVSKRSYAVMLVVGSAEFQCQCRGGVTGIL